jgi:hypothetical protein
MDQLIERIYALSLDDIQKLEKTEIKINQQIVYDEKYYYFLLVGVGLIFGVEFLRRLLLRDIV